MQKAVQYLSPSDAARQLGVSTKALRLYEDRGMITPTRTQAGWRTYGPETMARATKIVALRALGLSLAEVAKALAGDGQTVQQALVAHQKALEKQIERLGQTVRKVRDLRDYIAGGKLPNAGELTKFQQDHEGKRVTLNLPWPWAGEQFELQPIQQINFITGPLGSGKTRLAKTIADGVPSGRFLGLDRTDKVPEKSSHVQRKIDQLTDRGAQASKALEALVHALETDNKNILVIDLIEQDLDEATQAALIGYIRRRSATAPPVFLMTRSNVILDLQRAGPDEAILFCPANHGPPLRVAPFPGAFGYDAVASCLASPEVRKRTEGVIAMRPKSARSG